LAVGTSTITATYNGQTATFNVTVTAATVEYVTITWNLRGGGWAGGFTPITQVVKGGTLATPTAPTKNNCNFIGWYSDSALTQSHTFGAVNSNLNLYAKWQQITPQFYWGNFIPSTIVQATDLAGSPVFNIDELVATVENARTRHSLPAGQPTTHNNSIVNQYGTTYGVYNSGGDRIADVTAKVPGEIRWQEFKDWENAVKAVKVITWTTQQIGYRYFIYPKSYGLLNGITMIPVGDAMMGEYTQTETIIDGIEYYIYHSHPDYPITSAPLSNADHRFEFN
jgi:uncharacterized repeat protein (TIGR02543 family)